MVKSILLYPTYFSSIMQFASIAQSEEVVFEMEDNFQKQTYRNRCYIYGANGKQLLNIPVQHATDKESQRIKTKDIKIDYSSNWQKEHLKSLESAYRSSPFFEFYIDDLLAIFKKKETFLVDLNFKTLHLILELLPISIPQSNTKIFEKDLKENDLRFLVNSKSKQEYNLPKYTQVFDSKHGYISNLSILDLLFMEGPNALLYLENVDLGLFLP